VSLQIPSVPDFTMPPDADQETRAALLIWFRALRIRTLLAKVDALHAELLPLLWDYDTGIGTHYATKSEPLHSHLQGIVSDVDAIRRCYAPLATAYLKRSLRDQDDYPGTKRSSSQPSDPSSSNPATGGAPDPSSEPPR